MGSSIKFNDLKVIDNEFARSLFPRRQKNTNKGSFGKVLNIAGCANYSGAALLSSLAPLKTGAGLVVLASCSATTIVVSCQTPNVVTNIINRGNVISCGWGNKWFKSLNFNEYSVISIGSGLGLSNSTVGFIKKFLKYAQNIDVPIIYDADALNIIASENISELGKNVVLTPHPGEMARLMGTTVGDIQSNRLFYAQKAVEKYNATVVLKGHNTIIATPDGAVYLDKVGSQILAKAGMGDVLVGIIAGVCAQGVPASSAAILGVYIHSCSAECARNEHLALFNATDEFAQNASTVSLLASELIDFIPDGIANLGV